MKVLLALLALALPVCLLGQVPANNDCDAAADLGILPYCSVAAEFTNVNATNNALNTVPSCWAGSGGRDVWFKFFTPADGSIPDVSIRVFGAGSGNGTIRLPQIALYRGDCNTSGNPNGLDELACASAAVGQNNLRLDFTGLAAGDVFYVRVNDRTVTGSPNSGTFKLCVEKLGDFNLGDSPSTSACSGTLFDSGGPAGDYSDNENLTFSICPASPTQCIHLNLENYSIQPFFDFLKIYAGADVATGLEITAVSGQAGGLDLQIPGTCATLLFASDAFITDAGFKLTWVCSPDACTAPPPTTCAMPAEIASLPFSQTGLSNCVSGNAISTDPCGSDFLNGNDYIFKYHSNGDECIRVAATGTNNGAGLGLYNLCPDQPGAQCLYLAGGETDSYDPTISVAYLQNAGDYYLVFGAGAFCSPFDISVDTLTCPKTLPSAALCSEALNLAGCGKSTPQIIQVGHGLGDANWNQVGINAGCWFAPSLHYAFFYFTAGADGKFAFTAMAADTANEATDIDINLWGPIDSPADMCAFASTKLPIRSTWAGGDDPTGLQNVNPLTGIPVIDDYDCPDFPDNPDAGDGFVRPVDVVKGKTYLILLDDYGMSIQAGGIALDFSNTTPGVIPVWDETAATAGPDVTACKNQPVQLSATGGEAYFWSPDDASISCTHCQTPIVTTSKSAKYQVEIAGTCGKVNREVSVTVFDIDLGPDANVCQGAKFDLNPNAVTAPGVVYSWIGLGLSCTNCPTPTLTVPGVGDFTYIATLTVPGSPGCTLSDTLIVHVHAGQQPKYVISPDRDICAGQSVSLGGAAQAGTQYVWLANGVPFGFSDPNPSVNPSVSTTYYLAIANLGCSWPSPQIDSVHIEVFQKPVLKVANDTIICAGLSISLGKTVAETGVNYHWTPSIGLDNSQTANPTATPNQTITYNLSASNPGCSANGSITITVIPNSIELLTKDTIRVCRGDTATIQVKTEPTTTPIKWSPLFGITLSDGNHTGKAFLDESQDFVITASNSGCVSSVKTHVHVDSLPYNMKIFPQDTTVCAGTKVLLQSKVFEPSDFRDIKFKWKGDGQLTWDTLYQNVVQPLDTTEYLRIAYNGACIDTQRVTVNAVQPPMWSISPIDSFVCPGNAVTLHLTVTPGVSDIKWKPANELSCADCLNPTTIPLVGTTMFMVSGTFSKTATFPGCPVYADATVYVRFLPAYHFPDDRKLCPNQTINLNDAPPDPSVTTWTWTSTDPKFDQTQAHLANPTVKPSQTGVTVYSLFADNTCTVTDQFTVTLDSASIVASDDTTVCKGQPLTLTSNTPFTTAQGSFEWTPTLGPGQTVNFNADQTTTYTVHFNYGDGCVVSEPVTVTVPGEAPPIIPPNDLSLCVGESTLLNLDPNAPPPGSTYQWTTVPASTFTSTQQSPSVNANGTTTVYHVKATRGICTREADVTIVSFPLATLTTKDTTICENTSATLTALGSGPNSNYDWSPGGNGSTVTVGPLDQTTPVQLTYTYGDGCTLTKTVNVKVVKGISVSLACDPNTSHLAVGSPLILTANVTGNFTTASYDWLLNSNTVETTTVKTFMPETGINFQGDTLQLKLGVQVTSNFGCKAFDEKFVTLEKEKVVPPNAFTPNADMHNDSFRLVILRGDVKIETFQIFTRWGEKIYEGSDTVVGTKVTHPGWDGTDGSGNLMPSDVYIYVIQYRRGTDGALQPVLKGDVTLLR